MNESKAGKKAQDYLKSTLNCPTTLGNIIAKNNSIYKDIIKNYKNIENVECFNLENIFEDNKDEIFFTLVHMNDKGYKFIAKNISEILIKNRDILKEGESFVITLFKDVSGDQKRVNVKKPLAAKTDWQEIENLPGQNIKEKFQKKLGVEVDPALTFKKLEESMKYKI